MLVWGEADSETSPKRSLRRKLFKTCCMNWGEVNPTHAYYNGSCTIKDTEDPSWSTSFKTRRTQKTSSALEALWKTLFVLYLYLIGTLFKQLDHKQVWSKQLGPGVKTRIRRVHVDVHVWFELELQGAQGNHEIEVFQVSNNDDAVAQRHLEDKKLKEKINTDCLVKEQGKGISWYKGGGKHYGNWSTWSRGYRG
ncbi:hypothetical protein Tco_0942373 [Tanacetum coccineum]